MLLTEQLLQQIEMRVQGGHIQRQTHLGGLMVNKIEWRDNGVTATHKSMELEMMLLPLPMLLLEPDGELHNLQRRCHTGRAGVENPELMLPLCRPEKSEAVLVIRHLADYQEKLARS